MSDTSPCSVFVFLHGLSFSLLYEHSIQINHSCTIYPFVFVWKLNHEYFRFSLFFFFFTFFFSVCLSFYSIYLLYFILFVIVFCFVFGSFLIKISITALNSTLVYLWETNISTSMLFISWKNVFVVDIQGMFV